MRNKQLQSDTINEVLESTSEALKVNTEGLTVEQANPQIATCCQHLRGEIAEYLLCFKHPALETENEWRLCHIVAGFEDSHAKFRSGAYGITPYVTIDPSPMAGVNANRLPVFSVRHGPTTNPEGVAFSLRKLLSTKGYDFVEILGSELPVRV